MKVGLITLHRVTNFGSLLQTFATQCCLESMGHRVEVIDFVPRGLSFFRSVWPKGADPLKQLAKLLPLLICNVVQFRMTDRFLKKYIHLTGQRYHNFRELSENCPGADLYISGSDQVWNTQNNNPKEDLGAYCLAFVKDKPRVAYAGSFGKSELSEEERTAIRAWLKRYKAISVREDYALDTLKSLGLDGVQVLDPTLLLTGDRWLSLNPKRCRKGYLLVYNLNRNKTLEKAASMIAKENGWRVVNFADTYEFIRGAANRILNTPLDFIGYIAHADFVVTDSYHGIAFAVNFSKQFLSAPAPGYNGRLESFLRLCGCEDRMFTSAEQAITKMKESIDYSVVQKKLEQARKDSYDYLGKMVQR